MHANDGRWWLHDDDASAARACYTAATRLAARDENRVQRLVLYRSLYVDRPMDTLPGAEPAALAIEGGSDSAEGLAERTTAARKNAVGSAVDTMHSRLIKHQPRPWIVTTGADWDAYTRARASSQWLDGFFAAANVYAIGDAATHDMLIEGTGVAMVWDDDDLPLPQVELVRSSELHVDPVEEQVGKIRTLYRVRNIDREVLLEQYADDADDSDLRQKIEHATPVGIDEAGGFAQVVEVAESWRLPARPYFDAWGRRHGRTKGGRHMICLGDVVLLDEEWCDDDFPFVWQRWRRDPSSFWSIGLAEQLAMVQLDSNDLEATLCDAFAQMVPCWLVPEGSTPPEKISDARRAIYTFSPKGPPTFYAPSPVSPELLMRSQQQIDSAFQLAGVSQLSAAMMKPAGLNSGIALQNYQDVESERHISPARSRESFFCEIARKVLRCADRIAKRIEEKRAKGREEGEAPDADDASAADLMAVYGGRRTLRAVRYTSASLRDTPHEVRIFPVSSLAQTPAARLQQVNDMWNMGLIEDRASMLELLSMPDLDRYSERELSGRWEVDELVDMAIDGSGPEDLEVHSYMDHPYLRKRAQQMRSMARRRGAPPSVLSAFEHLISMADMFLKRAADAAAQAGPPGAAPPMPPGAAVPPPPLAA